MKLKILYNYKNNRDFFIFFIILVFFFLSINTKVFDILNFFTLKLSYISLINFVRSISPGIALIFLIIFLIKKKIHFIKNIKKELILLYFISFIIFQIIGSLNYKVSPLSFFSLIEAQNFTGFFSILEKYYYLINLTSVILFFFIVSIKFDQYQFKILFFASIIIIFFVYFPLALLAFKYYLFSTDYSAYWNPITSPENNILNQSVPRVTGLSRSLMIIYIVGLTFLVSKNRSLSNSAFNLGIFLALVIATILWSFQSRFSSYSFLIFSVLIILNSNLKKLKKIILILIMCILPILFFLSISVIKSSQLLIKKKDALPVLSEIEMDKLISQNRVVEVSTSGRLIIWKTILILSKESLIFGYGSQSDRMLLRSNDRDQDNASSGLFYALLCGGIAGLITYILISTEIIKIIYKSITSKFIFKKNEFIYKSSFYLLVFILLRSLVENSFMIFSLDNLIMFVSFYLLKKKLIFFNSKK